MTEARAHAEETAVTRELVERFIEAWFAADAEALVALIAENPHWRPPASITTPITDRELVAKGLAGAAAGQYVKLETLTRTVNDLILDGSRAVILVHLEAETLSGRSYVNEYAWCLEVRDGRVARIMEYADTLRAARLGFVPLQIEEG